MGDATWKLGTHMAGVKMLCCSYTWIVDPPDKHSDFSLLKRQYFLAEESHSSSSVQILFFLFKFPKITKRKKRDYLCSNVVIERKIFISISSK